MTDRQTDRQTDSDLSLKNGDFRPNDVTLYEGDCLNVLPTLPAASIDMILVDLPYGTTYAPWDSVIPLDRLWPLLRRVAKPKAAMVFTSSQPFTSVLVMSNLKEFRVEWIWNKVNAANFANANRQPMKTHESVLVFATGQTIYNPQKTAGKPNHSQGTNANARNCETQLIKARHADNLDGLKFPKSLQSDDDLEGIVVTFPKHATQSKLHSTQKPVDMFEYFILTYSNEGDTILDCTAGSGTTGDAATRCGRKAILIENDPKHAETIRKRCGLDATKTSVFPPEGWLPHPDSVGWFHNYKEVLTEAQLRDRLQTR